MKNMFAYAHSYNQDLCARGSQIGDDTIVAGIFAYTGCPSTNNPILSASSQTPGPFYFICPAPSSAPSGVPSGSPSSTPTSRTSPSSTPSDVPSGPPSSTPSRASSTSPNSSPSYESISHDLCQNFAVHARTTVAFDGVLTTIYSGNVGVSPGTSINGTCTILDDGEIVYDSAGFAASVLAAHTAAMAV
jgi:hypothetical protein